MGIFSGFTQEQLEARRDTLAEAILSGSLTVRHEGKMVTYRSLDEMRQIAQDLEEAISALSGSRRLRQIRIEGRKGFG